MINIKRGFFIPFSEVTWIKHLPSGEILVNVTLNKEGVESRILFRARSVVVSNGGKPSIPKEIFSGVWKDKLITADFLKKSGFESFIGTLNKNTKKRKIVIIGGSHSGFSSAWILLNGPACYNYNKNTAKIVFDKTPTGKIYKCKNEFDWGNHILGSIPKN